MTLAPLLSAPVPIPCHAMAAMMAAVLGALQLWGPKGTRNHRILGYVWVLLMAFVAVSGLFIHALKMVGPFNRAYDGPAGRLWRWLATGRGCWLARIWADRWPAARRSASDWWAKAGKAGDDGG